MNNLQYDLILQELCCYENLLKEEEYINLKNNYIINKLDAIKNKLWKCFLENEGSMTKTLKYLFENDLKMEFLGENEITYDDKLRYLENIMKCKLFENSNDKSEVNKFIERKILFKNLQNNKTILHGISYWNKEDYNKIYSENNKDKPLGLLIREKEIEYSIKLNNYIVKLPDDEKNTTQVYRISSYKNKGKIQFILIEIIYCKEIEVFFNKFE